MSRPRLYLVGSEPINSEPEFNQELEAAQEELAQVYKFQKMSPLQRHRYVKSMQSNPREVLLTVIQAISIIADQIN